MNLPDAQPPSAASDALVGAVVEGRYRIERLLGEGGMGRVYLARDEKLSRQVVLKAPHAVLLLDREFRARFEREVRALIELEHRGVITVHDCCEHDGQPFVVMEFASGGSVESLLELSGPQAPREIARWLPAVAATLDALHAGGALHRDVKPANILFDAHGAARLADFGIVKAIGRGNGRLTLTGGAPPGSPRFMAPEATEKAAPSGAYDQYSLGVTVYEALSGGAPHDGDTDFELLTNKRTQPPRDLAELVPDLPGGVVEAVMRALDRDAQRRHVNCSAFAKAFVEGLATPPRAATSSSTVASALSGVARGEPTQLPNRAADTAAAVRRIASSRRTRVLLFVAAAVVAAVLWRVVGDERRAPDLAAGGHSSSSALATTVSTSPVAESAKRDSARDASPEPVPPGVKAPEGWEVLDPTPGWGGWAKRVREPKSGIELRLIEPGAIVKSQRGTAERFFEMEQSAVRVDAFYFAVASTSQSEWARVMSFNPSRATFGPVDSVTHGEAREFASKIGCRLSSLTEWTYATGEGSATTRADLRSDGRLDTGSGRVGGLGVAFADSPAISSADWSEWCGDWCGANHTDWFDVSGTPRSCLESFLVAGGGLALSEPFRDQHLDGTRCRCPRDRSPSTGFRVARSIE